MHTIKVTPNLLFEYQCTSGKFIRLPNRPNWNALASAQLMLLLLLLLLTLMLEILAKERGSIIVYVL